MMRVVQAVETSYSPVSAVSRNGQSKCLWVVSSASAGCLRGTCAHALAPRLPVTMTDAPDGLVIVAIHT